MSGTNKVYRNMGYLCLMVIMTGIMAMVVRDLVSKENSSKRIEVSATQTQEISQNSPLPVPPTITPNPKMEEIVIDYGKVIGYGSPLVFGGAHAPNLEHQDAWDLLEEVGVTMIRRDFWIENELPKDITLEDYKNNKNNVQDTANWNTSHINETNRTYQNAQKRGLKVMGILSYSPAWLTHSGNQFGVPKDWSVYEDIVKKSYRLHRPYLDMIEIWNEPDTESFLDLTGFNVSRPEAYSMIFEHAVNAIKEVDKEIGDGKKVLIIAPAISDSEATALVDYLFSKPSAENINGISIHSYATAEPSWVKIKAIMKKHGKINLPIYISEWNNTFEYIKNNPYTSTDLAITYTGKKLIDFLNHGVTGANYYSTTYFNPASPDKNINAFGIYTRTGSKANLLPQGKTWRVLSRDLELGQGTSKIVASNTVDNIEILGAISKSGKLVVALINDEKSSKLISISANNLPTSGNKVHVKIYTASAKEDGTSPTCSEDIDVYDNSISFKTVSPENSVSGIIMSQPGLSLNLFFRVLGIDTNNGCISE